MGRCLLTDIEAAQQNGVERAGIVVDASQHLWDTVGGQSPLLVARRPVRGEPFRSAG